MASLLQKPRKEEPFRKSHRKGEHPIFQLLVWWTQPMINIDHNHLRLLGTYFNPTVKGRKNLEPTARTLAWKKTNKRTRPNYIFIGRRAVIQEIVRANK